MIITRPIQREIDNQKNKGNSRVGKRARQTHSLFKEILTSEQGYKVVQNEKPKVMILVAPSYIPKTNLSKKP